MSRNKLRPARMSAIDVAWGDLLLTPPSEGPKVIGTVLDNRRGSDCRCSFQVRTPGGKVIETSPVAEESPVWVHVPGGTA